MSTFLLLNQDLMLCDNARGFRIFGVLIIISEYFQQKPQTFITSGAVSSNNKLIK